MVRRLRPQHLHRGRGRHPLEELRAGRRPGRGCARDSGERLHDGREARLLPAFDAALRRGREARHGSRVAHPPRLRGGRDRVAGELAVGEPRL